MFTQESGMMSGKSPSYDNTYTDVSNRREIHEGRQRLLDRDERLIDELDLSRVRRKVLADGQYTEEQVDEAIRIYRMYLKLSLTEPRLGVPSLIVDEVWHQHILDTKRYHDDCELIFGRYIHHDPCHFTGNDTEDAVIHNRIRVNNQRTVQLLKERFGVEGYETPKTKCSHCEWCGGK